MLKDYRHLTAVAALAALCGCGEEPQANPPDASGGAGLVTIAPPQPPQPPGENAPGNNVVGNNAAGDASAATGAPANPAPASEQPAGGAAPVDHAAGGAPQPAAAGQAVPAGQAAPAEYAAFAPPVALYYETEDKITDLFEQVAGGLAPAEAAPRLQALTAEYQPRIRPYWLWAATATSEEKNAMVAKRFEMLSARHGGKPPMRTSDMIDLARQPGNDSFKAALAALFQAQVNGAPRLHAAQAQKLLDQLNR